MLGIASAGQDFNEEEKIIAKQMIESGISAPTGMANVSTSKFIELEEILSESVRKTNNESITQALDNLDFAEAAELTVWWSIGIRAFFTSRF